MRDIIDPQGRLQFGRQHRGEDIESIAREDPQYLEWIVREVEDISDEDREVIQTALRFRKRGRE